MKARLGQGFTRYRDGYQKAAWLFDGTTFWTFDDAAIMKEKARYVRAENLGGIMFWELSGDTPDGELIDAIATGSASAAGRGRAHGRRLRPPSRAARRTDTGQRARGSGGARLCRAAAGRPGIASAPGKIRTCDLCLRRAALYPLSYGRRGAVSVAACAPTVSSASSGTSRRT